MEFEIRDPMAKMIGVEIAEVRENGLTIRSEIRKEFCNAYSAAHGGYVYALGHEAAALSAQVCLGRQAVVADVSSQYVRSLIKSPAQAETELLRSGNELIAYRVHVKDADGAVCMEQTVMLKAVDFPEAPKTEFPQTIFPAPADGAPDEVLKVPLPKAAPYFAKCCHIYTMERGESGMIYAADPAPETCNLYGAAHGVLLYTLCDTVTGGSAAWLLEKKPVTVSSAIHYLHAAKSGPVRAEAKLIRAGKQLLHYDVDVTDGEGKLAAAAQFVLQCVDYAATNVGGEYKNKVFSS